MAINLAELAFAAWQATEEQAKQKGVVQCRHYYDGEQDTYLSDRLKEFLNAKDSYEFNLNLCRTIVNAVAERLIINGLDTTEEGDAQPVAEWANAVWEASRLDLLADTVHEGALRDGEYFLMVDWDADTGLPRFTPHQRYADGTVDGDNYGCKAHYPDDDTSQPMLNASKRWIENLGQGKTRNRLNLYFPDRVEKYELRGGGWQPFQDEGDGRWPLPWVDATGKALGIPVIHFRNTPDLRSEIWDAIPVQKAINKGLIDLLGNADLTGFQMYVALGFIPTSDGQPLKADASNMATVGPGQMFGTTRPANEASFQTVPSGDLRPLIDMIQSLIGWLAVITSTPESRLSFTRQIAAEGTLQEQNEGLFAKVRKRQRLYDAAWRDALDMARRVANVYGGAGLEEAVRFVVQWEPVQARDTEDERDEWRAKKELGVPLQQIWSEMGYSHEEIEAMMETPEYQARQQMMALGMTAGDEAG